MTPDLVAQILFVIVCLAILIRAEPANARMSKQSPRLIRIAFNLINSSALAGILYTASGSIPHWTIIVMACGIAVLLLCDRRVRALTGIRPINHKDNGARHA